MRRTRNGKTRRVPLTQLPLNMPRSIGNLYTRTSNTTKKANRQSTKKHNTYQLVYITYTVHLLMAGYKSARKMLMMIDEINRA
jgi:hypothetical protein